MEELSRELCTWQLRVYSHSSYRGLTGIYHLKKSQFERARGGGAGNAASCQVEDHFSKAKVIIQDL